MKARSFWPLKRSGSTAWSGAEDGEDGEDGEDARCWSADSGGLSSWKI
jgi:hypothetical protein